MTEPKEHPSNLLYRGQYRDTDEALDLLVAQFEYEATLCRKHADIDSEGRALGGVMDDYAENARRLRDEFRKHMWQAEQEFFKQKLDDPVGELSEYAQAWLDGDLSQWAI